ncbi:MAG: hypothetical protein QG653_385 [Patescibacteria group bacterium]|nr:hypothetical protein [Patescibacteria group bacterium]
MKQSVIIVITLIILIVGAFFVWRNSEPKDAIQTSQKEQKEQIVLYKESGFVAWKGESVVDYINVEVDEIILPNNVYVRTAEDGRGYVILPDNSVISLDRNTEIFISYNSKKVSIKQLLGSTYHRVESLVSGKEYEVRTPGTLAAVRGTKFGVSYDKKRRKTNISVTENKVDVVPIETIDEIATSTGKSVEAGMTAVLEDVPEATTTPSIPTKPRSVMVVQKTEKMIEEKRWIDENIPLDNELDKRKEERREYMKEFNKRMKEESKKIEPKPPTPIKPADETRERVTKIKGIIRKIEVERPDLIKPDDTIKSTTTDVTQETKNSEPDERTSPVGGSSQTVTESGEATSTIEDSQVAQQLPTLKAFDVSKDILSREEEDFTNKFYGEYETYLYVDITLGVCEKVRDLSGRDVVSRLEKFVNSAGYILPKKAELLSFADDLIGSCREGTTRSRVAEFQNRFDVTYPFSQ